MSYDDLISLVDAIDPRVLDYQTWLNIGFCLHDSGHPVQEWDAWSQRDPDRYEPGLCARKWKTFRGSPNPVGTGTVVKIAKEHGWRPAEVEGHELDWGDEPAEALAADHSFYVIVSDVPRERVEWLWYGRIPLGKLSVLDGDPGLGKSTLSLDIAARVTTGAPMPGEMRGGEPRGVVLLSAEDDVSTVIGARLDAAGADTSKVASITTVPDGDERRPMVLPDDVDWLERAITTMDAALVVVDPLMAFMSDGTDSHKDQSVRKMLHKLSILAEESGAAILIVRHLNKTGGGNPLYRGGGSIGIVGAARSGLLVGRDPDDLDKRILASTKCNLAAEPKSLAFHLENTEDTSRVVWDGTSRHTASSILAEPKLAAEGGGTAVSDARTFLLDALSRGPVPAKDIRRMAREGGISEGTLKKAKRELLIRSDQDGFHGGWTWRMPLTEDTVPASADPELLCPLWEQETTPVSPVSPVSPVAQGITQ
jgi:hypothetical protein